MVIFYSHINLVYLAIKFGYEFLHFEDSILVKFQWDTSILNKNI